MAMYTETLPPHDDHAEEAVLGALLLGGEEAAADVAHILKATDFYRPKHRMAYEAMLWLYQAGEPIHQVSVLERLRASGHVAEVGDLPYLSHLITSTPSWVYGRDYAEQVREYAVRRRIIELAGEMAQAANDGQQTASEVMEATERDLSALRRGTGKDGRTLSQALDGLLSQIGPGAMLPPVLTGVRDLDNALGGLLPGQLIVLAAKTSQGKSALAHQAAAKAAGDGQGVLIISAEMPAEEVAGRMLATASGVPFAVMRRWSELGEYRETAVMATVGKLAALPVVVEDRNLDVVGVRSAALRMQASHGLALIIVDYIQLVKSASARKSSTRAEDVGGIARDLKALAMELKVPVLALSQYNRDVGDIDPELHHLRESGDIEHSADVALLMWRPDREHTAVTEIKIAKNRNGSLARVKLYFEAPVTAFRAIEMYR